MAASDTRRIEILSDSPLDLEAGMRLAFGEHFAKSCEIGEKDEIDGLRILEFKSIYVPGTMFPCPLPADVCIDIALEWLKHVKYPAIDYTDGNAIKGFIMVSSSLNPTTICSIEPAWTFYSK